MIYTGYYANAKKYQEAGLKLVAISRGIPKGFKEIIQERALMPSWQMINAVKDGAMTTSEYAIIFKKILLKAHAWSIGNWYQNCILLCYEKPPAFCHRHLVAEWLMENGFECEEW